VRSVVSPLPGCLIAHRTRSFREAWTNGWVMGISHSMVAQVYSNIRWGENVY
jgi:hypothetical protein